MILIVVNAIEKYEKYFSFVKKIKNIYDDSNNKNNGSDLNNILDWINDLTKQNKYEMFCLSIMKKNNIQNFNEFQKIICSSIKRLENEGYFLIILKNFIC